MCCARKKKTLLIVTYFCFKIQKIQEKPMRVVTIKDIGKKLG